MIELQNITKIYKSGEVETVALRDVSLFIEEGEFVSVIGPSGSGKSTLMNIIGCLDTPTRGNYFLAGKSVSKLSDSELAMLRNKMIGFVFQQFNLLQRATVLENVLLPQLYSGNRPNKKEAMALLERLKIAGLESKYPNQLSGGQQQRVAIARALINKPKLILADEPTGSLDTKTGEEILKIFEELNEEGVTIVIVTHEPYIARKARRTVALRDGSIEFDEHINEGYVKQ
ncbi:MAG: ABC transporter ATP-binding protein [Actinobacteria bacterium]|nr:ABC transporter ATP-binding protein [Actinomycetota bacterium]